MTRRMLPIGLALALGVGPALAAAEVPAGTTFLVELTKKIEARKVKPGKKIEARTLEALRSTDGTMVPAGAKLTGRVTHASRDELILRFERIDFRNGKRPLVATVTGIEGEKHVRRSVSEEGEIEASSGRARKAAIGAAVLGGIGAAVGASQAGGKGAAIGAGSGAAAGVVFGAAAGGRDLVLQEGTRLELTLNRPLVP
jgi:hypothetical protein